MVQSDAYNYINILGKAADANWTRNTVISSNIANVDTPGYKRRDVDFEDYLNQELSSGSSLDESVDNADVSNITGTVYTDNANYSYRMDGNNVDIDTENSELAKNQLNYYAMVDSVNQEFSRLKMVADNK